MSPFRPFATIAGCAIAVGVSTSAQASTLNLATGLDSAGSLQTSAGSGDAWWNVTGSSAPSFSPYGYVVAPPVASNSDWGPGWVANGANSAWIAANPFNRLNGKLTLTRSFYVNDPTTAAIVDGAWTLDDQGTLSLNGHLLGSLGVEGWGALHPISTDPSDFVSGLNTLTIQITRTDFNIEGGRFEGTLVGDVYDINPLTPPPFINPPPPPPPPPPPGYPEPSTWLLMLGGFGGLGLALRSRRGQRKGQVLSRPG